MIPADVQAAINFCENDCIIPFRPEDSFWNEWTVIIDHIAAQDSEIERRHGIGGELIIARRERDDAIAERDALRAALARMEDALHKIKSWSAAYPLDIFPEPDFVKAREVLKRNGMTLDAISASNMRHVITQVQAIVDAAIGGKP